MQITLINPPFLFPDPHEAVYSHLIGLRSISGVLKRAGHTVTLIDALMLGFHRHAEYSGGVIVGLPLEEIVARVPEGSDLIGVSVPFSQLAPIAHDLIDELRRKHEGAAIVMGGVYPSTQPHLAAMSRADYIVKGEGENAILALASGLAPDEIPGIYPAGRASEAVEDEFSLSAKPVEKLDELPFPDEEIPEFEKYFNISPRQERGRTAALITSRGCPFDCEFCSIHPVCGYKWRARSPENILSEITHLNEKFGVTNFEFEDDNFTLEPKRAAKVLEGIIKLNDAGKGISWKSPNGIRIDTLDNEFIALIKKSNCTHLVLALEHGDAEMLGIMNKKLDLGKAAAVIEACARIGIPEISLFVIVGYPGETRGRFENGLKFLRRFRDLPGKITLVANMAQPYPGTKLLARCFKEGLITDRNIANFLVRKDLFSTAHTVSITSRDFDAQEVLRRRKSVAELLDPKWKRLLKQLLPWRVIAYVSRLKRGRV